jgi:rhodanese-related sulfurtransferase
MMPSVTYIPRVFVGQLTGEYSLLSIGDPNQEDEFAKSHPGRHRLEIDDVEELIDNSYVMFDYLKALKVLVWLEDQGDKDIVIHCEAGISRSAAVAKFMVEHLGYTLKPHGDLRTDMVGYNVLVFRQLLIAQLDRVKTKLVQVKEK